MAATAAGQGACTRSAAATGRQHRIGATRRLTAAAAGASDGGGEDELVELIKKKNMENPIMVYR